MHVTAARAILAQKEIGILRGLKACRERKGYTQESFAKKIGVDRSTVSKWESGEMLPRTDRLKKLSKLLDVTIDELL